MTPWSMVFQLILEGVIRFSKFENFEISISICNAQKELHSRAGLCKTMLGTMNELVDLGCTVAYLPSSNTDINFKSFTF